MPYVLSLFLITPTMIMASSSPIKKAYVLLYGVFIVSDHMGDIHNMMVLQFGGSSEFEPDRT